ncbi:mariner mos1 transposase [Trichonephila clavipes]|nr:mariner mos1 transposase [Trichonephila clavipes]
MHLEFISDRRTVNKELDIGILRRLRESIRRKGLKLSAEQSRALLHDNASAHRSFLVTDLLEKTKTTVLPHSLHSPDLALCDLSLFPKFARLLQGRQFQSADEVKSAPQA